MTRTILVFLASLGLLVISTLSGTTTPQIPIEVSDPALTKTQQIEVMMKAQFEANQQFGEVHSVLYIEDIALDVVMKSQDNNDYYLDHTREDKWHHEGELFFSQASNVKTPDDDLNMSVIYGHKMNNGNKFGKLKFLLGGGEATMYIYDGVELKAYDLVRAFLYQDGSRSFEINDLKGEARNEFLEDLSKDSLMSNYDNLGFTDEDIIFLQTCVRSAGLDRHVFIFVEKEVNYEN